MYPISDGSADPAEWRPPDGIVVRPADTADLVALAVELLLEYAALPHTAGRWTSVAAFRRGTSRVVAAYS